MRQLKNQWTKPPLTQVNMFVSTIGNIFRVYYKQEKNLLKIS